MHTSTDSKGNTRTTYSWDNIASGMKHVPFMTEDDTGAVLVDPEKAEFDVKPHKAFYQRVGTGIIFSAILRALKKESRIDIGGMSPIDPGQMFFGGARVGDRRYYEYLISPSEDVYVLGTAGHDQKGKNVVKKGVNEKTFIISDMSEKELAKQIKLIMILSFVIGGLFFLGGVVLLYLSFTGAL